MTILDRRGEYVEMPNMHGGKGMILAYSFFQGQMDPSMMFFELVVKPGAYAGHHRHQGNAEIIYVLSGTAENFQDGKSSILKPGDAILVKPGQAHVAKNIGDEDLVILGFVAAPGK